MISHEISCVGLCTNNDIAFNTTQDGIIPDPDKDFCGLFTKSEEFLQDHCRVYATSLSELKHLINNVLHHPEFDQAQADNDKVNLLACVP